MRTATAVIRRKEDDMYKTVLKIEDMMCGMCEAHVSDAIRKEVPCAKKVTASRHKKEASFLSEEPADTERLKEVIRETGYTCTDIRCEAYEKRGLFRLG